MVYAFLYLNMSPPSDFKALIDIFLNLLRATIPVIFGLSLLAFLWGLVKFVSRVGGDEKAVKEGKDLMIWGLIALFVMVSVWGIIAFVYRDVGFGGALIFPLLPPYRL